MKFIYPAIIRKEENGTFKATFPDLACCEAIGDSLDDVIEKANEAAVGWLELELSEEMPRRFFHRQSGMRKLCNRQHVCLAAEFLQS